MKNHYLVFKKEGYLMIIYEEKNGAIVPISIESKLLKERIILVNGEIDSDMSAKVVSELLCFWN